LPRKYSVAWATGQPAALVCRAYPPGGGRLAQAPADRHIDLYQMHHVDRLTPWEEIWQAMEVLVQQGQGDLCGSSNFAGWHIVQANEAAKAFNFMGLVSSKACTTGCPLIELEMIPFARARPWATHRRLLTRFLAKASRLPVSGGFFVRFFHLIRGRAAFSRSSSSTRPSSPPQRTPWVRPSRALQTGIISSFDHAGNPGCTSFAGNQAH